VRSKNVLTEVGPVEIEVPRHRRGSFEPQIVKKRAASAERGGRMVLWLTESAEALSVAADELSTARPRTPATRSPPLHRSQ
jgi:hypothetical protein